LHGKFELLAVFVDVGEFCGTGMAGLAFDGDFSPFIGDCPISLDTADTTGYDFGGGWVGGEGGDLDVGLVGCRES
jgi:hypothetical protein